MMSICKLRSDWFSYDITKMSVTKLAALTSSPDQATSLSPLSEWEIHGRRFPWVRVRTAYSVDQNLLGCKFICLPHQSCITALVVSYVMFLHFTFSYRMDYRLLLIVILVVQVTKCLHLESSGTSP